MPMRSPPLPSCCGERRVGQAGAPGVSGEPVRLQHDGALAVVPFDSPPLNLMDRPLLDGLLEAVDRLEAEPTRGVLFRAEGRAFSGGVDVSMFAAMDGPEAAERTFDELIELARRRDR